MKRILVLGGSGFVGRHFCEKAGQLNAAFNTRLTVPSRRVASAKHIQPLPWVDLVEADVHDGASLMRLVAGHDAVVNLVAILHGTEAAFNHVHVELIQKLVRACQATGVRRIVHVSALGAAANAPSLYQRSKAAGEAVLTGSGLDVTILRPSVVFGADDQLLNLFAKLQSVFPVMPLAGADTRFQPVWVEDVAQALVNILLRKTCSEVKNNSALRNIRGLWPEYLYIERVGPACRNPVWPLQASHRIARSAGQSAGPVHGNGAGPTPDEPRQSGLHESGQRGQRPAARPAGAGHSARVAASYCAVVSGTRPR